MSNTYEVEISIPSDGEGYVLLKCPSCSEKFMLQVDDLKSDELIVIWCPKCGLTHDNYLDDDVLESANRLIKNQVVDLLNDFSQELEKNFSNSKNLNFKSSKQLKREPETSVHRKVGDYEVKKCYCCENIFKLSSLTLFEGGYCPVCGEILDED